LQNDFQTWINKLFASNSILIKIDVKNRFSTFLRCYAKRTYCKSRLVRFIISNKFLYLLEGEVIFKFENCIAKCVVLAKRLLLGCLIGHVSTVLHIHRYGASCLMYDHVQYTLRYYFQHTPQNTSPIHTILPLSNTHHATLLLFNITALLLTNIQHAAHVQYTSRSSCLIHITQYYCFLIQNTLLLSKTHHATLPLL
jgi:hypothetical protein